MIYDIHVQGGSKNVKMTNSDMFVVSVMKNSIENNDTVVITVIWKKVNETFSSSTSLSVDISNNVIPVL